MRCVSCAGCAISFHPLDVGQRLSLGPLGHESLALSISRQIGAMRPRGAISLGQDYYCYLLLYL